MKFRRFQFIIITALALASFAIGCKGNDSPTEPRDNDSRIRASAFCYTTTVTGVRALTPVNVTLKSDIPYKVETLVSKVDGWTDEVEWVAKLGENGSPMFDEHGRPVPPDRFFVDARLQDVGGGVKYDPFSEFVIPFVGYDQAKPKDTIIVFDIELVPGGVIGAPPFEGEILAALATRFPGVVFRRGEVMR
jgi:hypothetical protein